MATEAPLETESDTKHWPELPPLEAWRDTFETLHRWTQIAKVRAIGPSAVPMT